MLSLSWVLLHWVVWILCSFLRVGSAAFVTRPDLLAPPLKIHLNRLNPPDKGFLFFTPYHSHEDGPVIYDLQGKLIWDGHDTQSDEENCRAHNLRPIEFQGKLHLAYTKSIEASIGNTEVLNNTNVILDDHYGVVAEYGNSNHLVTVDSHDFEVIHGGRALLRTARIDRKAYKTDSGIRPIQEAAVQVINTATRKVEFEWHSLDYVPVKETRLGLERPDYFHINSVTASPAGDYLISGYHTATIYLLDRTSGTIIWRLGGPQSNFTFIDNYHLKYVHHVRIRPLTSVKIPSFLKASLSNETHLAISLFDNAFDTTGAPTSPSSSALVILLDLLAKTARVIERYPHPQGAFAAMFGSMDFLPNGDRFIGWGSLKEVSQYTQSRELVYHAEIGEKGTSVGSLRAFKREWNARPAWGIDVYAYSWVCGWPTALYVSWNGATDVWAWIFYGGEVADGTFRLLGVAEKQEFETFMKAGGFMRFIYVEAVAEDGEMLGRSRVIKTRVPPKVFSRGCDEERCPDTLEWEDTSDACTSKGGNWTIIESQTTLARYGASKV